MKALTLWQPWASLVILGAKPYEFRTWPAPAYMIHQRIVIHAAARSANVGDMAQLLERLGTPDDGAFLDAAIARPFLERCMTGLRANSPLEYSCGLGTALLGEPIKAIDVPGIPGQGDVEIINPDMWAWPLTEIHRWAEPVDCKGLQGFWTWPLPIAPEAVQ